MLWRVPPETLARLLLPLGELTKPEVRERARRGGAAAGRRAREPGGLLRSRRPSRVPRGARRAEPGRRDRRSRGARARAATAAAGGSPSGSGAAWALSAAEPLYVLAIEAVSRPRGRRPGRGPRDDDVELREARRPRPRRRRRPRGAAALPGGRGRAWPVCGGWPASACRVELGEPFHGPAPGQSAVFYSSDVVVGGGIITSSAARRSPASCGCDKVCRAIARPEIAAMEATSMTNSLLTVAASTPSMALRYAAAFFLVVVGIGLIYALVRLGGTLGSAEKLLTDVDTEVVPAAQAGHRDTRRRQHRARQGRRRHVERGRRHREGRPDDARRRVGHHRAGQEGRRVRRRRVAGRLQLLQPRLRRRRAGRRATVRRAAPRGARRQADAPDAAAPEAPALELRRRRTSGPPRRSVRRCAGAPNPAPKPAR